MKASSARPKHTYFIYNPASNLLKIGRTSRLQSRLRAHESNNGNALRLLAVIDNDVEMEWHQKLAEHRKLGEWFRVTPDLKNLLITELGVDFGNQELPDNDTERPTHLEIGWLGPFGTRAFAEFRSRITTGSITFHFHQGEIASVERIESRNETTDDGQIHHLTRQIFSLSKEQVRKGRNVQQCIQKVSKTTSTGGAWSGAGGPPP